jgi:hypothetical protein
VRSTELSGAQAKLDRAREHFHELQTELRDFLKKHPEPMRYAFKNDPNQQLIIVAIEHIDTLDDRFSVVVGDMVHALRCVLDYIAWEVVKRGTKVPPENSARAAEVGFPVVMEGKYIKSGNWWPASKVFREAHRQHMPGARSVPLNVIDRYQPYKRGHLANEHPFAHLQQLSNTDKHRRLHTTLFFPSTVGFTVDPPPQCGVKGMTLNPDVAAGSALRVGMEIAYISVADKTLCNGMEVQPTATVYVGLENLAGSVLERLEVIESMAADLLLEIDAIL